MLTQLSRTSEKVLRLERLRTMIPTFIPGAVSLALNSSEFYVPLPIAWSELGEIAFY